MQIKGKIIIVTGASKGIGLATCRYLTGQGAKVVLAARSIERLTKLERELPGSLAVETDMRKAAEIDHLIQTVLAHYGRIDVLVNNAGQGMWARVGNIKPDNYKKLIELNVYGYLNAMQAVIPVMKMQGGGMIINISSMVTDNYYPFLGAYASTKYAVNALTLTAREELKDSGIIVSLMRPKLVETDFGKNSIEPEPDALRDRNNRKALPMDTPEYVAEKIGELIQSEAAQLDL